MLSHTLSQWKRLLRTRDIPCPTLYPTRLFLLIAGAFARKGKCSGRSIRLNKQPEEAIKQASKIYGAVWPEPQSRMRIHIMFYFYCCSLNLGLISISKLMSICSRCPFFFNSGAITGQTRFEMNTCRKLSKNVINDYILHVRKRVCVYRVCMRQKQQVRPR